MRRGNLGILARKVRECGESREHPLITPSICAIPTQSQENNGQLLEITKKKKTQERAMIDCD